ncbi:Cysteine synthase B [Serratia liquefaciens]|nr:Cysteine synthase B [Serratia liquefaciens]
MNTLEQTIGNTPLVKLQRLGPDNGSEVWVKLEGNNPAGSVKDRAALKGYRMKLLMPDNMSQERRAAMRAYGAELILVSKEQGMEGARDLALEMAQRGEGKLLDQFNNPDNPTPTTPPPARKSGSRPRGVSPTLSPVWGPPAPLPACHVFCVNRVNR